MKIAAMVILMIGGMLLIGSLSSIQTDMGRAIGFGASGMLMSLLGGVMLLIGNTTKPAQRDHRQS